MKYKVISFPSLPSTNDYLKDNVDNLDNYTFCYTSNQTNGKGRMGRSWVSEEGKNITISLLIKDFKNRTSLETITLLTACSLHKMLSKYLPNILIKWPNDLLVNHLKISGILVEAISKQTIEALIIGVGININQIDFKELNKSTTSLKKELNQDFDLITIRNAFMETLIKDIDEYLDNDNSFITYLRTYLYGINKMVSYTKDDNMYEGIIKDVDDEGKIIIEHDNELQHIRSGEIKILR